MPDFIPGLELSKKYYWEIVRPLLDRHFPGIAHASGLIGPGSEVLGFDSEMSMDHHWYPNVLIFLKAEDIQLSDPIHEMLRWKLPPSFMEFPLNLEPIPDEPGTFLMVPKADPPFNHNINPVTVSSYIEDYLGWDLERVFELADWLSTPSQKMRSLTSGAIHYDGVGEISDLRRGLEWYPHEVWLYLLAAGWQRISEEEHLMPRAGYVGDELGSGIIGSRLIRDILALCFLMEKQYAPYPKWFGTAFQELDCAVELTPTLRRAALADTWQLREAALAEVYQYLAMMHNRLGITKPLLEKVSNFHSRPFKVIHGERFAQAIIEQISDPPVQNVARRSLIGSIDQISDNTKLLADIAWQPVIRQFYARKDV